MLFQLFHGQAPCEPDDDRQMRKFLLESEIAYSEHMSEALKDFLQVQAFHEHSNNLPQSCDERPSQIGLLIFL